MSDLSCDHGGPVVMGHLQATDRDGLVPSRIDGKWPTALRASGGTARTSAAWPEGRWISTTSIASRNVGMRCAGPVNMRCSCAGRPVQQGLITA